MFIVLIGMLLLYLWLRRKSGPEKKYAMSDEAAGEVESVLASYRQILATHGEPVKDVRLLPESKDVIKQYLQVAIGLARLNKEPSDGLLEDYYRLAHFQDMDDLARLRVAAESDRQGSADGPEQLREELIAQETAGLERELEAFLKRRKLF